MVAEGNDKTKRSEHCPLLHVVPNAAGENVENAAPQLKVECLRSRSWPCNWRDYLSACWVIMFLAAMGIFCVYSLASVAMRRQTLIAKYIREHRKSSGMGGNYRSRVFCPVILEPEDLFTFDQYTEFLSQMSDKYPNLYFDIAFLIDDLSLHYDYHSRYGITKKVSSKQKKNEMKERNSGLINDFKQCHNNVNVTFELLSKYSNEYLASARARVADSNAIGFLTRVFAIWRDGGIAFDLAEFNRNFVSGKQEDSHISDIFEVYNFGNDNHKSHKHDKSIVFSFGLTEFDIPNPLSYSIFPEPANNTRVEIDQIYVPEKQNETALNDTAKADNQSLVAINETNTANTNFTDTNSLNETTNTTNVTHVNANSQAAGVESLEKVEADLRIYPKPFDMMFPNIFLDPYEDFGVNKVMDDRTGFKTFYDFILAPPERLPNRRRSSFSDICSERTLSFDLEGKFIASFKPFHPFLEDIMNFINHGHYHRSPKYIVDKVYKSKCEVVNPDFVCSAINIL